MLIGFKKIAVVIVGACFMYTAASACTETMVQAEDGAVIVGRTLEFGPALNSQIVSSPRERAFTPNAPDGQPGLAWKAKYGYLLVNYFGQPHAVDGINEKGLSFSYLYLPGYTEYPAADPQKDSQTLPYYDLGDWILGNFTSVDELKQALPNIHVVSEPMTVAGMSNNVVFPLHAMITDSTGKSIVIEFAKGKMQVYDAKPGIMTNSPTYGWQLANVLNYTNLSPYSPSPVKIDGITYTTNGQGAGMTGLPGDTSPPSRFVKMTLLTQTALPVATGTEAAVLVQHILNTVDIPRGMVRGAKGSNPMEIETTQWAVLKDLKNHILYFRSYSNPQWQAIYMNKVDFSANAPQKKIAIVSDPMIIDATQRFVEQKDHAPEATQNKTQP